ncbi:group 10 secretory phospholipase A2-like [Platysternon megacephalum]|uniref:Cleavage and polyadenylation specificity factor subunit 4 n=1 Tax=Platysternon megacephalum TaxID=55544 RepID=A0A4D9E4R7_9SAUR|nr:group 10 secretory phospholipase A2-like [Platysternon megacephalum]
MCPFRHISGEKTVVCKHWLRGLCKRGDLCEFLHEYDMTKMPECYFYSKFGECSNRECPFLHIDPASRIKDCPWYDRGFCKQGPLCKYKHTRRVMCVNYLAGFCPEGPKCKFMHPKADLMLCNSDFSQRLPPPSLTVDGKSVHEQQAPEVLLLSHQPGGRAAQCQRKKAQEAGGYHCGMLRPLGQVTCFKRRQYLVQDSCGLIPEATAVEGPVNSKLLLPRWCSSGDGTMFYFNFKSTWVY